MRQNETQLATLFDNALDNQMSLLASHAQDIKKLQKLRSALDEAIELLDRAQALRGYGDDHEICKFIAAHIAEAQNG